MCVCVCVDLCLWVCIHTYIHTHTYTQPYIHRNVEVMFEAHGTKCILACCVLVPHVYVCACVLAYICIGI